MAKDKSKKKKKKTESQVGFINEYDAELEVLRAKHEQLDGLIREVKIRLSEIKEMRKELADKLGIKDDPIDEYFTKPLDEE